MSNNSIITRAKMEADASAVTKTFGKIEKQSALALKSMVVSVRRLAQVGISMSAMFGGFVDQTYALGIEAGLLGMELVISLAAAEATTLTGAIWSLGFKGAFQAAAIVSMLVAINNLRKGRTEAARRSQGAVAAFRLLSF